MCMPQAIPVEMNRRKKTDMVNSAFSNGLLRCTTRKCTSGAVCWDVPSFWHKADMLRLRMLILSYIYTVRTPGVHLATAFFNWHIDVGQQR
jgi:hypothetical protein